jgi:hypothetical protein
LLIFLFKKQTLIVHPDKMANKRMSVALRPPPKNGIEKEKSSSLGKSITRTSNEVSPNSSENIDPSVMMPPPTNAMAKM